MRLKSSPVYAEEGGHDDGSTDEEHDTADQHHDILRNALFAIVYLDGDGRCTVQAHKGADGIQKTNHILHHDKDEHLHLMECVGAPGIVHRTARGMSRRGEHAKSYEKQRSS